MPADQNCVADAQAAQEAGDKERALQLWQALWKQTPGDRTIALGVVRALADLGRPNAILSFIEALPDANPAANPKLADSALRLASRRLPKNARIGAAFCRSAERMGNAREAEARWWQLRKHAPRQVAAHIGYIDCMIAQRRLNEAERAALSALRFLGAKPELLETHARVAEAAADWPAAAARWTLLHQAAPDHPEAAGRQRAAEQAANRIPASPAAAPLATPPAAVPTPLADLPEEALHALRQRLIGFESLGRNCEFGLLQRKFGAEPLGLLRFSTTRPRTLLQLLRTRFAGIGDPAQNEVVVVDKEYRLRHLPSMWRMHTGIPATADPAKVLRDQCRHTGFLCTKLIRDLEAASKIFVYQMAAIEDDEIEAIHAALQAYGPNLLLCVRLPTAAQPAGSVTWPTPRLMVAHIDRQGQEFKGAGWDISVDYWLHFCTLAETHRQTAERAA